MKTVIIFLMLATPCFAFDEWSKQDIALQTAFTVTLIADWSQTRHISKNLTEFHENNFILGASPTLGKINAYFAASLILHSAVTHILPSNYRTYWQAFWLGVETSAVTNNFALGVKFDF